MLNFENWPKYRWKSFREMIFIKIFIAKWDQSNMWLIYHHCTDLHRVQKQENISNDPKIAKIGQEFAEWDPPWRVYVVGSHLWTQSWIWKMPKFKLNLHSRFCMSHRYSYKSNRLFQSINVIFLSFSWRFSLMSDTKIHQNWNITMIYALYGSKCISIEYRTLEHI